MVTTIYQFDALPVGRWAVQGSAEILFDEDTGKWEVGHVLSATAYDGTPMPKTDVAAALVREDWAYIQDLVDEETD